MKTLFTIVLSLFMAYSINAQVSVTYQVDVSGYLDTADLASNGIRIAGNFAANSAVAYDSTMADWAPTDTASRMEHLGDSIYSITVTYPQSVVNDTQFYKFVNGNWENDDETATDPACAGQGEFGTDRFLVIPSSSKTLQYCWNACTQCDGSDPNVTGIEGISSLEEVSAYPNPASGTTVITYSLTEQINDLEISVMDALGRNVATLYKGNQVAGNHNVQWDASNVNSGVYFYTFNNGKSTVTKKLMVIE